MSTFDPRDDGCICQSCCKRYKIDLSIPDDLWNKIRPQNKPVGAGLLCGSCIMKSLEKLNEFNCLRVS